MQVVYKDEAIWATQAEIVVLFEKNKSTISRHIANIYSEGELLENPNEIAPPDSD